MPRQGRPLERERVQAFNIFDAGALFLALVGTSDAGGQSANSWGEGSLGGEEPAWPKKGGPGDLVQPRDRARVRWQRWLFVPARTPAC